jgi:hypothetical protein
MHSSEDKSSCYGSNATWKLGLLIFFYFRHSGYLSWHWWGQDLVRRGQIKNIGSESGHSFLPQSPQSELPFWSHPQP